MITHVRGKWAKVAAIVLCVLLTWYCLGGSGFAVAAESASDDGLPAESAYDAEAADKPATVADEPAAVGEFESVSVEQTVEPAGEGDADPAADEAAPEGDAQLLGTATSDEPEEDAAGDEATVPSEAPKMQVSGAPSLRAVHNDVITKIEAWVDGNSAPMMNVSQWQVIRLNASFDLRGHDVHAGDTTTIALPNELMFYQTVGFPLLDTSGNVVANAEVNGSAKVIRLTYTDYPETHSGTHGDFHFYARIDRSVVTGEMIIPLLFNVDGTVLNAGSIHFEGYPAQAGSVLGKSGEMIPDTVAPRHVRYKLNVNTIHRSMRDVVVTDLLTTPGITVDQDSIEIIHCNWVQAAGDWDMEDQTDVTDQYAVWWNSGGTGFSLSLGDLGADDGFQIRYTATADYDFSDGEIIRNRAYLTGNDVETTAAPSNVTYYIAGGSAEGYVYSIQILKTAEGRDDIVLSGAMFDVIRVINDDLAGTIITGADGTGSFDGLLHDTYKLVETRPPGGYELLTEPIFVYPDDFDDDSKVAYLVIENSPETTNFTVDKIWTGPIADGPVTVHLTVDGRVVATGELSADNGWRYIFEGLPKYDDDGTEISYEVEEIDLPGWSASYDYSEDGNSVTITNTNVETIDISATKTWVGPAAGPVTLTLTADGLPIVNAQLNEANGWQHTFRVLPKYDPIDGHLINYDVQETPIAGYDPTRSGTVETGFTFTNTITGFVSIPVTKLWVGPVGGPVTVALTAGGQQVATAELSEANGWQHTFAGLPKYSNGTEIRYEVEELDLPGWSSSYSYGNDGSVTITNTNVETIDIPVAKTWIGPAAGPVTVTLTADGLPTVNAQLNEANGWQHTFAGLPKHDPVDGHPIEYDVQEAPVSGYDSERSGSVETGFTFTNTSLETADISGSKTWIDGSNQDGVRPASITVRLLADGNEVGSKTVTADDGWSWSFAGMPVYDRGDGHRIVYSVTEDAVEGYSTSYAGFDVTNSHAPGKISVTVTKAWRDENDKDGSRPQSVTVRLLADGTDTGKELVLSPNNNWTGSFEGLDAYNAGSKIAYTVAEEGISGYVATIAGDAERGYVIENAHTPTDPPSPSTPTEPSSPNTPPKTRTESPSPKTGDGLLAGTLALAGIASAAIAVMIAARRRRSRDV